MSQRIVKLLPLLVMAVIACACSAGLRHVSLEIAVDDALIGNVSWGDDGHAEGVEILRGARDRYVKVDPGFEREHAPKAAHDWTITGKVTVKCGRMVISTDHIILERGSADDFGRIWKLPSNEVARIVSLKR